MQKLEQSTLIGIETDHLRKFLTFLDYFHLYIVQTSGFLTSFQLVNLNCMRWNLSGREKIKLEVQQLPAELEELVKTDDVDELHLFQAIVRVPARFAVKFKLLFCPRKFHRKKNFSSMNEELICLLNENKEAHIYQAL